MKITLVQCLLRVVLGFINDFNVRRFIIQLNWDVSEVNMHLQVRNSNIDPNKCRNEMFKGKYQ